MPKTRENPFKSVEWVNDSFGVGLYKDAATKGISFNMALEGMKENFEGELSPYSGMTKAEVMKTKAAMRAAGQAPPLTAFETLIAKSGIRKTDKIIKYFEYSGTDVLFPALISDQVEAGIIMGSLVPDMIYESETVTTDTYKKLFLEADSDDDDLDIKRVVKLADLPKTKISTSDRVNKLGLFGRYLQISEYDKNDISMQAFANFMVMFGLQIGVRQTDLAIKRLRDGDGNANTTPQGGTLVCGNGADEISFKNTLAWAAQLPTPFKMSHFIVRKTNWTTWHSRLYDGSTSSIGSDKFKVFPNCLEWDRSAVTANYGIGYDKRFALKEITTGAPKVEYEKLVRSASEGTAITTMFEYAVSQPKAVAVLDMHS